MNLLKHILWSLAKSTENLKGARKGPPQTTRTSGLEGATCQASSDCGLETRNAVATLCLTELYREASCFYLSVTNLPLTQEKCTAFDIFPGGGRDPCFPLFLALVWLKQHFDSCLFCFNGADVYMLLCGCISKRFSEWQIGKHMKSRDLNGPPADIQA